MNAFRWIWPFCLLFTAACETTPEVRIEYVNVPVGIACIPRALSAEPQYSDTDEALRAAEDAAARFLLLILGREERKARAAVVEPVVIACNPPT